MKKIILALTFLSILLPVSAQQLEKQVLTLAQNHTILTGSFTETKEMPKLKKKTVKQGNLYFQRPDGLAMRYTAPEGDYSVIKDGKFFIKRGHKAMRLNLKDPDSQFSHLKQTLLFSLSGDVEAVAKENDATIVAEKKNNQFVFTIDKKNAPKVGVCRLKLVYDNTGALLLLRLEEANGNYTAYETSNISSATAIADEVWTVE